MRKGFIILIIIFSALLVSKFYIMQPKAMSEENAIQRVEGFIQAVNDNNPAEVYKYLSPDIKELINQGDFEENFAKERSYPYLTPLYLYLDTLELSENKQSGNVECIVAARLPGQRMNFSVVYVKDNYYVVAFRDIADGSFIKKFDKL
ncbi:MAG: hypothetical protein FH758_01900 [Firmicutes bacterium]|nr:hypothetical protein [Bacillota bacterium]